MKQKLLRFSLLSVVMMLMGTVSAWAADTWVKTAPTDLANGDVVVIVDQTSSRAMSNDNGTTKAPAATSITLSSDKSEISGEVASNLQWVVTVSEGNYQFNVANTEDYLYCTSTNNGVRVGTGDNKDFTIYDNNGVDFLVNTGTSRYIGVYNSQDWRCYTSINANIRDCVTAFYKKVTGITEKPSHVVTFSVNGETSTANVKEGATIEFPEVDDVADFTCVGWTKTAIDGTQASAEYVTSAVMEESDVTFYAVFAISTVSGESDTYSLVSSISDLKDGDKVVLYSEGTYRASGTDYSFSKANKGIDGGKFADVDVEVEDNKFTSTDVVPMTLVKAENTWKFKIDDKFVTASSKAANLDGTGSENTITINNDKTASIAVGDYKLQYNPNSGNGRFAYYSSTQKLVYLYKLTANVTYSDFCTNIATTITIGETGWATFCSDKALDFEGSSVEAYIVTGNEGNAITKTKVTKAPAGTGLLVTGTTGDVKVIAEADAISGNKLTGVLTATTVTQGTGSNVNYVLVADNGKAVFQWIGTVDANVPAGKAYLTIENGPTESRLFIDDTTDIRSITNGQSVNDNAIYDLSGRRVENPTKGIYIMNGKKVVVK